MIDPKELRIGNYIHIDKFSDKNEPQIVASIHNGLISYRGTNAPYIYDVFPSKANPIPITPEWLERFGFKLVDGVYELNERFWIWPEDGDWNHEHVWFDFYHRWNHHDKNWHYDKVYIGVNPKYVHLLQNLLYALTEEEPVLTIN